MKIPEFTFEPKPLDEAASENIFSLLIKRDAETPLESSDLAKEFLAQVLLKRVVAYGLPFKFTDFFFIASIVTFVDNPGKIMALLRLCWQHWRDTNNTNFNLNYWVSEMFPWGIPSDSEIQKWWDSQKSPGAPLGNLVDDASLWQISR